MTANTSGLETNAARLLSIRATGAIVPPATPTLLPTPEGAQHYRPGQGGVVLGVSIGDPACGWASDHLEPGVSLAHADPAANRALQILSCVGNDAVVVSGPACGRRGVVVGKHGTILVAFTPSALAHLAPGDTICITTQGVGLAIVDMPDVSLHSTDPDLLDRLVRRVADRLIVRAVAILPPDVAAAGIGMDARWANLDLETHDPELRGEANLDALRFGDIVVLSGHDHRFGRQFDPQWSTVGVIAHGESVSGGHGLGFASLLTAPTARLAIEIHPDVNLGHLLRLEDRLQ